MSKKVVLICPYSYPSKCGIWKRVYDDAKALISQGFEVHVFSSNILKGTNETLSSSDELEEIKIHRFKVWFSLGGNAIFFFFWNKLKKINPEVIHVHGYRHPHSLMGFLWEKLHKKTVFITTHAPFLKDKRRSFFMKIFDVLYDFFIGRFELKRFNKIISIAEWEIPFLKKLKVPEEKVISIPNGISNKFLNNLSQVQEKIKNIQKKENFNIFYMGRLDPIKRVEWLDKAAMHFPQHNFRIIGPLSGYKKLEFQSSNLELIIKPFTENEFIEEAYKNDIYVIASFRESFGITPLEAMSQGCLVLSTNTKGAGEYLKNEENGFIFNSEETLIEKIDYVTNNWDQMKKILQNSLKTAENFSLNKTQQKLIQLYKEIL